MIHRLKLVLIISTGGSMTVKPYQTVGPAAQTYGYGFGVGNFGGTVSGVATNDLDGALAADFRWNHDWCQLLQIGFNQWRN